MSRIHAGIVVSAGLVAAMAFAVPAAHAAFPGPDGKIAFQRTNDIFTIGPGGGNLKNVTSSGAAEFGPRISPDGRKLAYTIDSSPDDIATERIGGSTPNLLTKNFRSRYYSLNRSSWSPSGTQVAFACLMKGQPATLVGQAELCRINANGTNFRQITSCDCVSVAADDIEWGPRGIIFYGVGGLSGLQRVGPNGGTITEIVDDSDRANGSADWSPSGNRFVWEDYDGSLHTRSWTGGGEQLIYESSYAPCPAPNPGVFEPAYSPQGNRVVAVAAGSCANPQYDDKLAVIDIITGTPTTRPIAYLTDAGTLYGDPDWGVSPSTLTLAITKTAAKITARGSLTPASPGDSVRVTLYRKRPNGTWQNLGSVNDALNATSQYVARFDRPAPGSCKMRAKFAGDATAAPATTEKAFAC